MLEAMVEDEGGGISNPENLFVPFFTTKPKGSGIGLVLSRQIAEVHGGRLTLENRRDHRGCRALVVLPLSVGDPSPPLEVDRYILTPLIPNLLPGKSYY